ncbi:glycine cleavage system H-protein subunit [Savitreella phatthalungensis]
MSFTVTRSLLNRSIPTIARSTVIKSSPSTRAFTAASFRLATRKAYTPQHEWISVDLDTRVGTVGVTEYAQKQLGDVVYCEVVEVGTAVERGESLGAVESVKSASDIYAPVSGELIEMNPALADKPSTINKAAEGEGWLAKIKCNEDVTDELDQLLDADAYASHCQGEEH